MEIRAYREGDEEPIASLWDRRVRGCYATPPLSPQLFLSDVVGKRYFEPEGLALGSDGGQLVALAHAGFKSSDWIKPDPVLGTLSMVAVEPDAMDPGVRTVTEAVRYLLRRGAKQVEAFTIDFPNTPFYNGLYGGEKAGMDEDHPRGLELMERCGFRISNGAMIMMCELADEPRRAPSSRNTKLRVGPWESPMAGTTHTECYGIPEEVRRASLLDEHGVEKAGITFWHLDRYNRAAADHLAVVSHVGCAPELRGTGAAAVLQHEVHRILREEGAERVGLGAGGRNGRAVGFYRKLGYRPFKVAYSFFLDWRRYGDYR